MRPFSAVADVARLLAAARRHDLARHHLARAMTRFAKLQLVSRVSGPMLVPFVDRVRLHVSAGQTGANGNYYFGLHEFADMAFTLHYLRTGDLFVDAGANVGSYTLLASGAVGATSRAFEPVPETATRLRANLAANALDGLAEVREICLGARSGTIRFTSHLDTVNHIAGPDEPGVDVPLRRVDEEIATPPNLLKVDAEGFDDQVLAGADRLLSQGGPMALIVETDTVSALARLTELGFEPCSYDPCRRSLSHRSGPRSGGNALMIRGFEEAEGRLRSAPRFDLHGLGTI